MTLALPIYLDSHATTPCAPEVIEAMLPCFDRDFGNAASGQHAFGWTAQQKVEQARETIARWIGANPREIVFTSGATESDNLAIKGVTRALRAKGNHVVTTCIEHKAVLDSCYALEREGVEATFVSVGSDGCVRPEDIEAAMRETTVLVSVMYANNEIGTVQPIAEIGALCKRKGVLFHSDAVQALAWLPIDVGAAGVDLLSISAHKMYGPKGVGVLYARRRNPRARMDPLIHGGGHERGMRSGTLNVPGIVGLSAAAELVVARRDDDARRVGGLRDELLRRLHQAIPDAIVNGSMDERLPCNLNISFPGVDSDAMMSEMTDIAISSGSACTSATLEPSYVLRAIGATDEVARGSLRIGLGRYTTNDEIEYAAERIVATARKLRERGSVPPACDAGCDSD